MENLNVNCEKNVDKFQCKVSNIPVGRKLSDDFKILIGLSQSNSCFTIMDYNTNTGTGICDVPIGILG
jgi:hypothetical protein